MTQKITVVVFVDYSIAVVHGRGDVKERAVEVLKTTPGFMAAYETEVVVE